MIKNIIFDLGGVILNVDYQKTSDEFRKLGLNNFDELYSQAIQSRLFDDFEKGLISDVQFREGMRRITGIIFCDMELDKAWNAMLLDLPQDRIELLIKAKKHYRTFLLSNTNSIHYNAYTLEIQQNNGLKSLSDLFEKEYYSHKIHLRKPDLEAFQFVLSDAKLRPNETLFIDDSIQHLAGAQQAQIHTFFMNKSQNLTLSDVIDEEGFIKNSVITRLK